MGATIRCLVRRDTYRDSVELMRVAAALEQLPGVARAALLNLYELRKYQVRIFYTFRPGRRVVLLDGIVKKQDKIPADVLKRLRAVQAVLVAREERGKEERRRPQ
jgi:capsular polysaccharide biosynthesis protein